MFPRRPRRRRKLLRRWRVWLPLLCAALWWLLSRLVLLGAPGDGSTATHLVREGDTIPRLCWQYRVRAETIRAANPGVDDPLPVGRKLLIPLGTAAAPGPAPAANGAGEGAPKPPRVAARDAFLTAVGRPAARDVPPEATPAPVRRVTPPAPPAPVKMTRPPPPPVVADAPPVVTTTRLPPAPAATPREAPHRVTLVSSDLSPLRPAAASRPAAAAPNFEDAARWLMARNIRYNENWTPPGEREPWDMDCSNTVRWLYRTVAGVDLPRTASDQYESLRRQGRAWDVPPGNDGLPGTDYIIAHLRLGDLLFWENTYEPVRRSSITHVMILLGEDDDHRWKMTGSQTHDGVSIYEFDPEAAKGGYTSLLGNVYHPGRFVAYARP